MSVVGNEILGICQNLEKAIDGFTRLKCNFVISVNDMGRLNGMVRQIDIISERLLTFKRIYDLKYPEEKNGLAN